MLHQLEDRKQLVHAATMYYCLWSFQCIKNSCVVLVLILIFPWTLWKWFLFFKILWLLFILVLYNLPVYSLCHFSSWVIYLPVNHFREAFTCSVYWKISSNLLCYHLCLCFWFWYLMFFEALIFTRLSNLFLFLLTGLCVPSSQFQGYPNSFWFSKFNIYEWSLNIFIFIFAHSAKINRIWPLISDQLL